MLIDVDGLPRYTPNVYRIPNLLKIAYDDVTKDLRNYTGRQDLEIEYQHFIVTGKQIGRAHV